MVRHLRICSLLGKPDIFLVGLSVHLFATVTDRHKQ